MALDAPVLDPQATQTNVPPDQPSSPAQSSPLAAASFPPPWTQLQQTDAYKNASPEAQRAGLQKWTAWTLTALDKTPNAQPGLKQALAAKVSQEYAAMDAAQKPGLFTRAAQGLISGAEMIPALPALAGGIVGEAAQAPFTGETPLASTTGRQAAVEAQESKMGLAGTALPIVAKAAFAGVPGVVGAASDVANIAAGAPTPLTKQTDLDTTFDYLKNRVQSGQPVTPAYLKQWGDFVHAHAASANDEPLANYTGPERDPNTPQNKQLIDRYSKTLDPVYLNALKERMTTPQVIIDAQSQQKQSLVGQLPDWIREPVEGTLDPLNVAALVATAPLGGEGEALSGAIRAAPGSVARRIAEATGEKGITSAQAQAGLNIAAQAAKTGAVFSAMNVGQAALQPRVTIPQLGEAAATGALTGAAFGGGLAGAGHVFEGVNNARVNDALNGMGLTPEQWGSMTDAQQNHVQTAIQAHIEEVAGARPPINDEYGGLTPEAAARREQAVAGFTQHVDAQGNPAQPWPRTEFPPTMARDEASQALPPREQPNPDIVQRQLVDLTEFARSLTEKDWATAVPHVETQFLSFFGGTDEAKDWLGRMQAERERQGWSDSKYGNILLDTLNNARRANPGTGFATVEQPRLTGPTGGPDNGGVARLPPPMPQLGGPTLPPHLAEVFGKPESATKLPPTIGGSPAPSAPVTTSESAVPAKPSTSGDPSQMRAGEFTGAENQSRPSPLISPIEQAATPKIGTPGQKAEFPQLGPRTPTIPQIVANGPETGSGMTTLGAVPPSGEIGSGLATAQSTPEANIAQSPRGDSYIGDHPITYANPQTLKLSDEVPQFKKDVKPLTGKWDDRGVGPVQVWQRNDGSQEIISGRNRWQLAKDQNVPAIPVQVYKESDGFKAKDARLLDVILNIRDNQGSVADYAQFFRETGIPANEAGTTGLLDRDKGRQAWTIASNASPDTFALHQADKISDNDAAAISAKAPGNADLQAVGTKAILDDRSTHYAVNLMEAAKAQAANRVAAGSVTQGKLWDFDDSAIAAMEANAAKASVIERGLRTDLNAVEGAAKNPERASVRGVKVKNVSETMAQIVQLRDKLARMQSWATDPELYHEVTGQDLPSVAAAKAAPAAPMGGDLFGGDAANQFSLQGQERVDPERALRARQAAAEHAGQQAVLPGAEVPSRAATAFDKRGEAAKLGGDAGLELPVQAEPFNAGDTVIYHSPVNNQDIEVNYRGKDSNGNAMVFDKKSGMQFSVRPETLSEKGVEKVGGVESPIRYNPAKDNYTGGGLKRGDVITDGKREYVIDRLQGYTLGVDALENGKPTSKSYSISVDNTSPEFKGDVTKTGRNIYEDVAPKAPEPVGAKPPELLTPEEHKAFAKEAPLRYPDALAPVMDYLRSNGIRLLSNLAGEKNSIRRTQIIRLATGEVVPKSKAGIHAMMEALGKLANGETDEGRIEEFFENQLKPGAPPHATNQGNIPPNDQSQHLGTESRPAVPTNIEQIRKSDGGQAGGGNRPERSPQIRRAPAGAPEAPVRAESPPVAPIDALTSINAGKADIKPAKADSAIRITMQGVHKPKVLTGKSLADSDAYTGNGDVTKIESGKVVNGDFQPSKGAEPVVRMKQTGGAAQYGRNNAGKIVNPFDAAAAIYKRIQDFGSWSKEMMDHLGDWIKPKLAALWNYAKGLTPRQRDIAEAQHYQDTLTGKVNEALNDSDARLRAWVNAQGVRMNAAENPADARENLPGQRRWGIEYFKKRTDQIVQNVLDSVRRAGVPLDQYKAELNQLLTAQHAPERNAVHGDGAAGMTNAQAAQVLGDLQRRPYFSDLQANANEVRALNREALQRRLDTGLITPSTHDTLNQLYPNHVPLNRVMPEDSMANTDAKLGGGPGLNVMSSGLRAAKGSDLPVQDILGNVYANAIDSATRGAKNVADNQAVKFFRDNEAALNAGGPMVKVIAPKIVDKAKGGALIYQEPAHPDRTLVVRENGKPVYVEMHDREAGQMLQGLNAAAPNSVIVRALGRAVNVLGQMWTTYSLPFKLGHFARSAENLFFNVSNETGKGTTLQNIKRMVPYQAQSLRAVADWMRGADTPLARQYEQYRQGGGIMGGFDSMSRDDQVNYVQQRFADMQRSALNPVTYPAKAAAVFHALDQFSDATSRFTAYRLALDAGKSPQEANAIARRVALDFDKNGTITKELNALWKFSKIGLQSTGQFIKVMKNPRTAALALTTVGLVVAAQNKWNDALDPNWRTDIPQGVQDSQLPIITKPREAGSKEPPRYVQMPFSYAYVPMKVMAQELYNFATGRQTDPEAATKHVVGAAFLKQLNPFGGTFDTSHPVASLVQTGTPTLLRPITEAGLNRRWSGGEIHPDANGAKESKVYFPGLKDTAGGRLAIGASNALSHVGAEVSPDTLAYLGNQYGGGPANIARYGLDTGTKIARGEPLTGQDIPGSRLAAATNPNFMRTRENLNTTRTELEADKTNQSVRQRQAEEIWSKIKDVPLAQRPDIIRAAAKSGDVPSLPSGAIDPEFLKHVNAVAAKDKLDTQTKLLRAMSDDARAAEYLKIYNSPQMVNDPAKWDAFKAQEKAAKAFTPKIAAKLNQLAARQSAPTPP